MKEGIHPEYTDATVICACGNQWTTRSTRKVIKTDLCSKCHPFFTGEQRIVDTAGQVERFMRRMNARQEEHVSKKKKRADEGAERIAQRERERAEMRARQQAAGEEPGETAGEETEA
jgi:large subunit ribosomal protein L31